jgi:uncharacterized membrane protein
MSWRTGFLLSLAVNILIIGALAGFALGGGLTRVRGGGAMAMLGQPRAVAAALPQDVRQALRRDLVQAWFETDDERAAWRAANAEVLRELQAEPYDVVETQAALRRQREAGATAMGSFQDSLAQSLAALTPEQRRAVADALTHVRARRERTEDAPLLEEPSDGAAPAPEGTRRERLRERIEERLRERRQN